MKTRLSLQTDLETALGSDKVYFEPPANIVLSYPCIVYSEDTDVIKHADDKKYHHRRKYTALLISKKSENDVIRSRLDELDYCSFARHYISDNLHHYSYTIYN